MKLPHMVQCYLYSTLHSHSYNHENRLYNSGTPYLTTSSFHRINRIETRNEKREKCFRFDIACWWVVELVRWRLSWGLSAMIRFFILNGEIGDYGWELYKLGL